MCKREMILRNRLEMVRHNLSCYSANCLCDTPKEGMEVEYKAARTEVEMLNTWLNEFHSTRTDSTREFIGCICGWKCGETYYGGPLAESLFFEVDTGAYSTGGDRRMFEIGNEVQCWFVGKDGKYDIEKDRRNSRLVKITVDRIGFVRNIEWVFAEETE